MRDSGIAYIVKNIPRMIRLRYLSFLKTTESMKYPDGEMGFKLLQNNPKGQQTNTAVVVSYIHIDLS